MRNEEEHDPRESPGSSIAGLLAFMVAFAVGCGDDDDDERSEPASEALTELGEGEGEVNLIAWAGYVEDGSTDPKVDWVTDFEKETGCQVNVKIGNTSDEMVQLMRTGRLRRRLGIGRRDHAPDRGRRRRSGQHRPDPELRRRLRRAQGPAVQHRRRPDVRRPARPRLEPAHVRPRRGASRRRRPGTSSSTTPAEYSGQGHRLRQPDLHRRRGAVPARASARARDHRSLRARPGAVRRSDRAAQGAEASTSASTGRTTPRRSRRSPNGDSSVGTTWQVINNLINAEGGKEEVVLPEEGATGWSDTWMISSEAENPNCMYMWMNHIISPEANAQVAEWFGEAPSNEKSCELTADPQALRDLPRGRRGVLRPDRVLEDPRLRLRRRPR